MHFVYLDDSGDSAVYGYSALVIPADEFRACLNQIKRYRRTLRDSDGVFINRELHAVDFCTGRGRPSKQILTKRRRSEIFRLSLEQIISLPSIRLLNAFGSRDDRLRTLERLVNRINVCMKNMGSRAVLIFDEGEERAYTRLVRKMGVYNPISSNRGFWEDGSRFKNIPIEYVIEDPHFKRSKQSYFIQMADFCGYALLQKERPPTNPKRLAQGIHLMFPILEPICVKEANRSDPFGIIR